MKHTDAITHLDALAHRTRLEVFRLLVQAGAEGVPAGELGEKLRTPNPTLSFHLTRLRHAGLVSARRVGRHIFYAANYDAIWGLIGFLTENCCGQSIEGCGPDCEPYGDEKSLSAAEKTTGEN